MAAAHAPISAVSLASSAATDGPFCCRLSCSPCETHFSVMIISALSCSYHPRLRFFLPVVANMPFSPKTIQGPSAAGTGPSSRRSPPHLCIARQCALPRCLGRQPDAPDQPCRLQVIDGAGSPGNTDLRPGYQVCAAVLRASLGTSTSSPVPVSLAQASQHSASWAGTSPGPGPPGAADRPVHCQPADSGRGQAGLALGRSFGRHHGGHVPRVR